MTATLLSMIQDVADETSLPRPSTVIGSSDQTARTLLAHANREGRALVLEHDFTVLTMLHTFTLTTGTAEYALPDDYSRLIRNTEWDRSNYWPLIGPLNARDWEVLKSSNLGSGLINKRYRIVRGTSTTSRKFVIDPTPVAADNGQTMAFEYISKNWCADAVDGTGQDAWAADTDVPILDEDLMKLGIIVRYRRSRGLSFDSEAAEYMDLLEKYKGQDRPSPDVSLVPRNQQKLLDIYNLPETGFGS